MAAPDEQSVTTSHLTLESADGVELDAELARPAEPEAAMVFCHPHPLYGGNMQATVVDALFRRLPRRGIAVLRFDFRGVGRSGGTHDDGTGERLDVVAALDALIDTVPGVPVTLGGWSFGADVSLAVDDPRHAGWFGVAPPLGIVDVSDMVAGSDPRPKILAIPEHDQFNPPERAEEKTAGWNAVSRWVVPGTDHFLAGGLDRVEELAVLAALGSPSDDQGRER